MSETPDPAPNQPATSSGPMVVKIGGSTLGAEDTTIEDIVALQRAGARPIVVHGGGAMISDWLDRLGVESRFVHGLRSTNAEAIEVVVGVLRGVVNTRLVGQLVGRGGTAIGLSGVDGGMVRAEQYDPELGFVGRVTAVDPRVVLDLVAAGSIPVIAPIGLETSTGAGGPGQPLNINADTMAGEVAHATGAERLIFLTDVDGLLDADGALIPRLAAPQAEALRAEGTLAGGMIPKVEACFRAASAGTTAVIANGRSAGTLRRIAAGETVGTRIED